MQCIPDNIWLSLQSEVDSYLCLHVCVQTRVWRRFWWVQDHHAQQTLPQLQSGQGERTQKTWMSKTSSIRSIWTYLTVSPCYTQQSIWTYLTVLAILQQSIWTYLTVLAILQQSIWTYLTVLAILQQSIWTYLTVSPCYTANTNKHNCRDLLFESCFPSLDMFQLIFTPLMEE